MLPISALRRTLSGAVAPYVMAMGFCVLGPIAHGARAQSLAKPAVPLASSKSASTPPAALSSSADASQQKAPVVKAIPKPGPGANDAGEAATALRTVKLSLAGLIDRSVTVRDKREIGHVVDVLVDAKGQPAALVVDVGGFMGMGNRRIAIAWERFALAGRKPGDPLQLPLSDAQVKAAPAYDGSQKVTVVQNAVEQPASRPSRLAGRPGVESSRVDLGEGLAPLNDQVQPTDPLNPD